MRTNSADTDSVSGIQKSKRPPNTAFRQQRLKAWQPILSPQSILPLLMLIICVFSPIGIALLLNVRNVQDFIVNYSHCDTASETFQTIPGKYLDYHFKHNVDSKPQWRSYTDNNNRFCEIEFSIPGNISKPVYAYYKLTNFYQNHRKYVQSFDLNQLKGKAVSKNDLSENCKPLDSEGDRVIYPCGLIANSLFNDTFSDVLQGVETTSNYTMSRKGISWKTDRSLYKKTNYTASQIVPPPNWKNIYPDGYTDDNIPNLASWEEFQVWMRTAGLPRFYKLALKNEEESLPSGKYIMRIGMNYPVTIFGGTKSFVLTSNSVIGARNISLGVAYLGVAIICCIFELIFIVKVIIQPRKLGDHTYLNFDQQQESSSNPPIASQLREML